jgi:predicted nuclease with TOPRIM domain
MAAPIENFSISELATGALVGLIGVAFGLQKIFKGWLETSTELSVINLMHDELSRMSAQNKILSEELNKLQLELIKLNTELELLTIENRRLHADVSEITKQLDRLRGLSSGENFE